MAITNITGNNNQSGGQTVTPLNWGLFNRQMYSGNTKGLDVTQTTTPSMAVSVSPGLALLDYQTISSVQATVLTPKTVAISTANTSNPRIDTVVIYEDTSVTMPTSEPFSADAGNGRFKLRTIDGTPAASPVALSDGAIQSTIGAGMAWTRLADVRVNANVTSIINSNITSRHSGLRLSDSGWQQLTVLAPFVPQGEGLRIRKIGNIVNIAGFVSRPTGFSTANTPIANIPVGYRPGNAFALSVSCEPNNYYAAFATYTGGYQVLVRQSGATAASAGFGGSWIAES